MSCIGGAQTGGSSRPLGPPLAAAGAHRFNCAPVPPARDRSRHRNAWAADFADLTEVATSSRCQLVVAGANQADLDDQLAFGQQPFLVQDMLVRGQPASRDQALQRRGLGELRRRTALMVALMVAPMTAPMTAPTRLSQYSLTTLLSC